jgi:hypothetical protein
LNHHVVILILNANVCPRCKAGDGLTIFSPGHVSIVPLFWKGCGIRSALNMDLPLRVDWVVFIMRTKHLYYLLLLNNARIVVREAGGRSIYDYELIVQKMTCWYEGGLYSRNSG